MNLAMVDSLRDCNQALETIKDKITAAFRGAHQLDRAAVEMWCGDAGEMYSAMVAVAGLLPEKPEAATAMLEAALSRYLQVRSEVRALGDSQQALGHELDQVFSACLKEVRARSVSGNASPPDFIPRVVRFSPEEYRLPCSVCGAIAVVIKSADGRPKCSGITRSVTLDAAKKDALFSWLAAENLPALHSYMEVEREIEGGLDAYCPCCDKIFCREHYRVSERWDEGFYDCSYGECPAGHNRLIDD